MKPIDISPHDLTTVRKILRTHVPDLVVRAFGSRVTWTAREASDLDLALMTTRALSLDLVVQLRMAFAESVLPFRVDIVDWAGISGEFKTIIEQDYVTIVDARLKTITDKSELYRPNFPTHWNRVELYSLARWIQGTAVDDMNRNRDRQPIIGALEIENDPFDRTMYTQHTLSEKVPQYAGDLLLVCAGNEANSIGSVRWCGTERGLGQNVLRVTPTSFMDQKFLYYILKYLRSHFVAIAQNRQASGFFHVTIRDLKDMQVAIPELHEQRTISSMIQPFDDKIELNEKTTTTIESIAHEIFKSWFIDPDSTSVGIHRQDTICIDPAMESARAQEKSLGMAKIPVDWREHLLDHRRLSASPKIESSYCSSLYYAMRDQYFHSKSADTSSPLASSNLAESIRNITHREALSLIFNHNIGPLYALEHFLELESDTLRSISNLLVNKLISSGLPVRI